MIPLNIPANVSLYLANLLGYKIAQLPITYLGVPLHNKTLGYQDWLPLIENSEKKTTRLEQQFTFIRR